MLFNVLALQNYLGSPWSHTWSLAVEEHFYLLLPFALLGFTRLGRSRGRRITSIPAVPMAAFALIVFCTAARCYTARSYPYRELTSLTPTHLRIDGLFFGVMISYYRNFLHFDFTKYRKILIFIFIVSISPMHVLELEVSGFVRTAGFVLLYVGYGCVLLGTAPGASAGGAGGARSLLAGSRGRLHRRLQLPDLPVAP